jgi:hypothetical protein
MQSVMVYPVVPTWNEITGGSEGGPLAQRGWVVQERHLARRAVHFTPRQLLWDCASMKAFKDYPDSTRLMQRLSLQILRECSRAGTRSPTWEGWEIISTTRPSQ